MFGEGLDEGPTARAEGLSERFPWLAEALREVVMAERVGAVVGAMLRCAESSTGGGGVLGEDA